jgi:hypothetical protein
METAVKSERARMRKRMATKAVAGVGASKDETCGYTCQSRQQPVYLNGVLGGLQ